MKPLHILATIAALSSFCPVLRAEVRITELMQSNLTYAFDDLKDYPDSWVELYNDGTSSVDLSAYSIGIKKGADKAWPLPSSTLKAGEYVLVYCDKAEQKWHTSFRLESDKDGKVYLFKNGEAIQMVEHPAQPAPNIGYGEDAEGNWGYEFTPTPGKKNSGAVVDADHVLAEPVFNTGGAVNPSLSYLRIYVPDYSPEGTVVRYTTDGTEPTEESPDAKGGSPISMKNLTATTIIRARTFCEGYIPSATVTHTFLMHHTEQTIPIVSMVGDKNDIYSSSTGILGKDNYQNDWRRPVNVEFFDVAEPGAVVNQLCETRVGGGWSRCLALKSMMIYANKRFGTKHLEYEFFPDQKPGLAKFKSVMLRNAGNDFYESYMRDGVVQRVVGRNSDIDWQAFQPAVLYINGAYKGMLNLRERSNDDNIFSNYDGLEDIDMIENWSDLKAGTMDSFNAMLTMIASNDNTAEQFRSVFDVDEVLDVHLVNLYFNNTDFPGNNIVLWRPTAEDGRWRIIIKDTDYAMGIINANCDRKASPSFNTIEWLHTPGYSGGGNTWGNPYAKTRLFRRLMDVKEIRERFFDRAFVQLGDYLNHREVLEQIDLVDAQIREEWGRHEALYANSAFGTRTGNVAWMREWIEQRTPLFYDMLAKYYKLSPLVDLVVDRCGLDVTFNDLPLHRPYFEGKYESGREIRLHVDVPEDYEAIWCVAGTDTYDELEGPDLAFAPTGNFEISVRLEDVGIREVEGEESTTTAVEYFDMNGRRISAEEATRPGIYIIRTGSKTEKRLVR